MRFVLRSSCLNLKWQRLLSLGIIAACGAAVPLGSNSLCAAPVNTQPITAYGPWKSAPIRGGGYLQQVFFAPSDSNRMYLTSDVGGFWRSDNGGRSWRMLHGALPANASSCSPRGFWVDARNADHILVATGSLWGSGNGIFVSNDGGASWKQTLKARFEGNGWYRSGGNVLVASPANPNLVIAGPLGGGIQRSTDGGQTWQASGPSDLCPTAILFDKANPNRVWLCAKPWSEVKQKRADGSEVPLRGGLLLSEDGGKNWTQLGDNSPEELIQDPRDPKILFGLRFKDLRVATSTDNGRTWKDATQGLAPDGKGDARKDGTYAGIAAGPDFLLLGGHGGHFYLLNKGETVWHEIVPGQINEGDWWGRIIPNSYRHFGSALGFIGIDPRNPKHWVFTDWYALYHSYDAGQSWNLTLDGIEMTVINTVAQEPTNPQTMHAGMADVGYFQTRDSGRTMQQNTQEISSNIKCIAPALAQPGRVYATGTGDWEWKSNALFISDDAGKTWRRSPLRGLSDMKERRCETVTPNPAKPDDVWLCVSGEVKPGEGGPYHSVDGGQSWTWAGEGLKDSNGFFRSGYWVSGPELAASGDGSVVAASDDGRLLARRGPNDATWTMLPLPDGAPNCVSADPLVPGRFYLALQGGGLWRSDDSGKTWGNLVAHDVQWVTPDFKVRDRIAAVTPTGVLVSTDAGKTWRAMSEALPYRQSRNTVCFAGDNLFVGTGGNGVFYAPLASLRGQAKSLAREVAVAGVPASLIQNGSMVGGTTTPESWILSDYKQGQLALTRDTQTVVSAPAALRVGTTGRALGVVQQALQPIPHGEVTVSGKWKVAGNFESVSAVLQVFDANWKQIDWKTLANGPKNTSDWQSFKGTQTVRDDAAHVLLNLAVTGDGQVWLDDVSATSASLVAATKTEAGEATALPVDIAATDSNLHYSGRFETSDPNGPRSSWPASTVEIHFRGSALNARLSSGNNVRWQIEVDGQPTQKIKGRDGEQRYRLADNLPAGEHTVRLIQATEALYGTTQVRGFELSEGGRLLPTSPRKYRLEVIGDSISAGYGNEAKDKEEHFSPDTENAYFTYGAIAARELNADYTCLAWSGKKMWPDNSLPELYDFILPQEKMGTWKFKTQPDAVLINLATNDFAGGIPEEKGWTKGYKAFIARVSKNYPHAQIYCAIGPMMGDWGPGEKPLTTLRRYLAGIVRDVNAGGDARVSVLDFGTQDGNLGFGADWHPNVANQKRMAAQFVQTLRAALH